MKSQALKLAHKLVRENKVQFTGSYRTKLKQAISIAFKMVKVQLNPSSMVCELNKFFMQSFTAIKEVKNNIKLRIILTTPAYDVYFDKHYNYIAKVENKYYKFI